MDERQDEKNLKQAILIVNDVNKYRDELVKLSKYYNRGFWSLFINFDYTINRGEIEKLIVAINSNKLNVGENINDFILSQNIKNKKVTFIVRLKKSICGIINHIFFKKLFIKKLNKFNQSLISHNT